MAAESPARITRVVLKNYKSIVHCDVELKPLTILVGPNGSGKSNFVDALRFTSEALTVGLEQAIRNRGNVQHVLSEGRPAGSSSFSIRLYFHLESGQSGHYSFAIRVKPDGDFSIGREELVLDDSQAEDSVFSVTEDGTLTMSWNIPAADSSEMIRHHTLGAVPSWVPDRLLLANYPARPEPSLVSDFLTSMAFYNPIPALMRSVKLHESSARLQSDGSNVANVLQRAVASDPELVDHVGAYLARILPGLREVRAEDLGGYDLLSLRQSISTEPGWWDARPDQISDGTLRALGVLVALFQGRLGGKSETSLVGIEEPESGVHPAAARILLGAMQDASYTTQVLATTHSADMLTMGDVDLDSILVVAVEDGVTRIGPLDDVSRTVVRDQLYTIGELLQADQIYPKVVTRDDAVKADPAPVISGP